MCDETKDVGKEEQLSICLRYVDCGVFYEDFYKCHVWPPGRATSAHARVHLSLGHLCAPRCRFLRILHRQSCKVFRQYQKLYKFFSASVPHDYFHSTQKELRENIEDGNALSMKELKSLSKTRWCSPAEACDAVATQGSVIKPVEHFADDDYRERRPTAQIIVGLIDTDYIVCLVLFQNFLRNCNFAANYLQSTDIDTSKAVEFIDALRESLDSPELFDDIWQNATTLTNAHEIAAPLEIRRRRCRKDLTNARGPERLQRETVRQGCESLC